MGVNRHNLRNLDCAFPLGVMTTVTGISGSGKSSLVSQALVDLVGQALGAPPAAKEEVDADAALELEPAVQTTGEIEGDLDGIKRLIVVDQKPIGRTPRSNIATYTGLFDHVRALFAATPKARRRGYDAGQFSFNVAKGRCPRCEGEGFVMVELLFLPSVYAPCPVCHGARYNPKTLEIDYRGKTIADVLALTVEAAWDFFADAPSVCRSLKVLREVGLNYIRLGQPATELSGGEAQRVKLATELQRSQQGRRALCSRRADNGTAPIRCRTPAAAAQCAGRRGQHRDRRRSRHDVAARATGSSMSVQARARTAGKSLRAGCPQTVAKSRASRTAPYLARAMRTYSD